LRDIGMTSVASALGDLQDLRTLSGVVTGRDARVDEVTFRVTSAGLREAMRLLDSAAEIPPLARVRSYDSTSRTATVLLADRVALQLFGLTREPEADDQFSFFVHPLVRVGTWRSVVPEPGEEWSPRFEPFTFRLLK
jgi:hypothetical protein